MIYRHDVLSSHVGRCDIVYASMVFSLPFFFLLPLYHIPALSPLPPITPVSIPNPPSPLALSIYEAVTCLRRIRQLLAEIDPKDRLKSCRDDYHSAATQLRCLSCMTADCDLIRDLAAITNDFFNLNFFGRLPPDVVREIFVWLVRAYRTSFSSFFFFVFVVVFC